VEQPEGLPIYGNFSGSHRLARFASILGHPMLVMPLAAWLASRSSGATLHTSLGAVGAVVLLGIVALAYSAAQVRSGRWRHVDASDESERRSLNMFLLLLFTAVAALAWLRQGMSPLAMATTLSATIIVVALMISPFCKLSLHVAFIAFAAFIPGTMAAGIGFGALGAGVAWSRLKLGRHGPLDLAGGLLAGAAAGIVFLTIT
jgi:membrane-associated phospholipid phosphatase